MVMVGTIGMVTFGNVHLGQGMYEHDAVPLLFYSCRLIPSGWPQPGLYIHLEACEPGATCDIHHPTISNCPGLGSVIFHGIGMVRCCLVRYGEVWCGTVHSLAQGD